MNKLNFYYLISFGIFFSLLVACGGGGTEQYPYVQEDDVLEDENHNTGSFIDSPVAGLTYKTQTQSGTTNISGNFKYIDGETVEFHIATVKIGSSIASSTLYPEDIDLSAATGDEKGLSIARVLQTLDANNNLDDGIDVSYITNEIISYANQSSGRVLNNNLDIAHLYDNPDSLEAFSLEILRSQGINDRSFVSEQDAKFHLKKNRKKREEEQKNKGWNYDSFKTSKKIQLGITYNESIKASIKDGQFLDNDYFRLDIKQDGLLNIKAQGNALTDCYLYDVSKSLLAFDNPKNELINRDCNISHNIEKGTYFIRIYGSGVLNAQQLPYSLITTIASPLHQPNISQFSAKDIKTISASSVQFDWTDIDYATYYQLYSSNAKYGFFEKIADISTSDYQDNNLVSNRDYYYKLKACDSQNNCSNFSANTVSAKSIFRNAQQIMINSQYSNILTNTKNNDFLMIILNNKGQLNVLNQGLSNIDCYLYDASESILQKNKNIVEGSKCIDENLSAGRYYIKVAIKDGGENYTITPNLIGTDINKNDQTNIIIKNIHKNTLDANFSPDIASGGNGTGGIVVVSSSNTPVAKVVDNQIDILAIGASAITAYKAGDDNYNKSQPTTFLLTVSVEVKQTQDPITIANMTKNILDKNFIPEYSQNSSQASTGNLILQSSSSANVAIIVNNKIDIVGVGETTISAYKAGDDNYNDSDPTTFLLTITAAVKQNQDSITINSITKNILDKNFSPNISSGGNGTGSVVVTDSSNTNVAKIINGQIDIVGIGETTITAHKQGDDNYNQSTDITFNLTIEKAEQTNIAITRTTKTFGNQPFTPTYKGGSGTGALILSNSLDTNIATVNGNTITIVGGGETMITAYKQGDDNYNDSNTIRFVLHVIPKSVSLLIVRIEFNDIKFTNDVATWRNKIFGTGQGNLNHYFLEVSNDRFQFIPAIESNGINDGIMTATLNMDHPNPGNDTTVDEQKSAIEMIDQNIDFSQYDLNNDGVISKDELQIMFLVAGAESAYSGPNSGVWAHASGYHPSKAPVADGVRLMDYYNNGSFSRFGERHGEHDATIGIIAHELGHAAFGLPDLYDYDDSSEGIGNFGLMGSGTWGYKPDDDYSGETPVHLVGWSKYQLGFVDPIFIKQNGTYSAEEVSYNNQIYIVENDATKSDNQYFIIENRHASGYDLGLYILRGSSGGYKGGLLITHIDTRVDNNNDDAQRLVDVEEANDAGLDYHIDSDESHRGHVGNLFYQGNLTTFNDSSTPNSKKNDGSPSGITITNIGERGQSIQFGVAIDNN